VLYNKKKEQEEAVETVTKMQLAKNLMKCNYTKKQLNSRTMQN